MGNKVFSVSFWESPWTLVYGLFLFFAEVILFIFGEKLESCLEKQLCSE